jgi:hypothetical protein
MPEEIPKFDPNKPYNDVSNGTYREASSSSTPPPFDPNKPYRSSAKQDFQEEGFSPDKYISDTSGDNIESTLDFIQNKMPGLRDMRDDEKDILRSILKNPNATKEDKSSAIRTFKGVHAEQVYNQKGIIRGADYYMDMDEKGVYKPIPLAENKPIPAGKNVASVWGTGTEAQDDSWYTDLAKKAFNIIPSAMEGVTDLFTASSSDLRKIGTKIEGKEYEKSSATGAGEEAKKFFEQFKFPTSEEYNQQIYDAEGVKNFEDLISKDRFNISPKTIYGTVSNLAGSVGEMLLTGGAAAEGMLAKKSLTGLSSVKGIAPTLSKAEKYASVYTGSFITNLGEAMDAAKKAGISDEDAGSFALALTVPIASLDAGLGIGGKILSNKLANQGKKELLENIASRVAKDEFGNITEESLKKASSEAVMAYTPVAKSLSKLMTKDVLEQGSEESLQSFISSAGEQLYDKLSDADKAKFGTDAFSAQSFGKYISEGVAGLIGSGPLAVKTAKAKQQELYKAQSNSAYETVMQGEDAVKAFRANVTNSFEKGEISKEDYDNAILKVDAYDSYEKTTKDLTLDNDNKKKLFELSLQKENLKAAIKDAEAKDTEGHSRLDKMNPAELGLHNSKMKQAKALQDEIDLIVSKSEVLQQPEVAEKVVEKVVKAEEKAAEGTKVKEGVSSEIGAILGRQYKVKTPVGGEVAVPGKAAYEVPKKVLEETRKMKDIPVEEFNDPNFDVTVKQAKLAEALDETPEKTTTGTLQIDNEFTDDKGRQVQTFNITLPNGKSARFASSMVRFPEENAAGGFRGNTYEENLTNKENPVGQKLGITVRTLKDSGRKVIFVWNAEQGPKFGKHIGMVKERLRGKSEYGAADLDEMADLRMINMGQNPNAPAPGIFTPKEPTKGGPKVSIPLTITTDMRRQLANLGYKKADVQSMKPEEANDIINTQRTKSKTKKQPLEEVEVKDKKAAAKVEKKIADLRAQEQEELKKEIPNIDKYKVDGKVDESLIKDAEDLKKYKEIYDKYDKKISPLLEKDSAEEKGKVKVKKAPKELSVEKKESIAKREALMESIRGVSKLVAAYNGLTKAQKKSKIGVDLYKKIQDRAKEINYTTKISRGGTLQLVGEKGKRVYKTPVRRSEDQKAMEKEKKQALGAEPTSIAHSIILDIATGAQFDVDSLKKYFSEVILKEMPSLLKNSKGKGISLEFYKQRYDESLGLKEPSNLDEDSVAQEAADVLSNYFIKDFRQAATEDAMDIDFKTRNQNMSRSQIEDLNEMQKEQDKEQKELEDILAQEELEKEEYRRQAEQEEGYLQKAKVKPATLNKFEESVDLFYQTKDADGASKKRGLAAKRREFLEKNPTIKYIDDNMKYIYKQLEEQNIIERKGECP